MQGDFQILLDSLRTGQTSTGPTLLCVCPNSKAVVDAAVSVFAAENIPLLFVATLNQVDTDGGYTGWTPLLFRGYVEEQIQRTGNTSSVFLCLDHGGPWKKRTHQRQYESESDCMSAVQNSIEACVQAGYTVFHIDATGHPSGAPAAKSTEALVDETIALQGFAESISDRQLFFEVGTREDGLGHAALGIFEDFLHRYDSTVRNNNLAQATFVVGDVGTNLRDTRADELRIRHMVALARKHGALLKAHYSDDIINKSSFPRLGVGAANIGPGLSGVEYSALHSLYKLDTAMSRREQHPLDIAIISALERAGYWGELVGEDADSFRTTPANIPVLGYAARYVWQDSDVDGERNELYERVAVAVDAGSLVNDALEAYLKDYISAFRLDNLQVR